MARPEKWRDDFARMANSMARLGATDAEIAEALGVSARTLNYWKASKDGFAGALKAGKSEADARVERALYHRAVGYEQEAVKIFMPAGSEKPVYAPYIEKIQPDTTAAIFWLKNRRPEEWRDKRELEHSGEMAVTTKEQRDAAVAAATRADR